MNEKNYTVADLRNSPTLIYYIKNPTEEQQLAAVNISPGVITNIKYPTEKTQLAVVKRNGYMIDVIFKHCLVTPSETVQLAAVTNAGDAIDFIENPSTTVQLVAVQQNPYAIMHITNPNRIVQLTALKGAESKNSMIRILNCIRNPDPLVVEYAKTHRIMKNSSDVWELAESDDFFNHPSITMRRIRSDPYYIAHISKPTEEQQILATSLVPWTIFKITRPCSAAIETAIKSCPRIVTDLLEHGIRPSEDLLIFSARAGCDLLNTLTDFGIPISTPILLASVTNNPLTLSKISSPTRIVQLTALKAAIEHVKAGIVSKQYPIDVYNTINNPDPLVKEYLQSKGYWNLRNSDNLNLIEESQELLDDIMEDPSIIMKIRYPSDAMQIAAVKSNPAAIEWISGIPCEEAQLIAFATGTNLLFTRFLVNHDGYIPSENVQLTVVRKNGILLKYIIIRCGIKPTLAVQLAAISNYPWAIEWIERPSRIVQLTAVKANVQAIYSINKNCIDRLVIEYVLKHHPNYDMRSLVKLYRQLKK